MHLVFLQAFQMLRDNAEEERSLRAAVAHEQDTVLHKVFGQWAASAAEAAAHAQQLRAAAARWTHASQGAAFSAWLEWTAEQRRKRELVSLIGSKVQLLKLHPSLADFNAIWLWQ